MFRKEISRIPNGALCTIRIEMKGKIEWVDGYVIKYIKKRDKYQVRTNFNQQFEVERSFIKWVQGGERCTHCGNLSNRLVTQSAKNVGGTMVQLLRPGERLCPCCASLRGHETLDEIHTKRTNELAHG
jgi:hypothetical protein